MRALYAGAGLALTAGLLLGAAMKPQLVSDGGLSGPKAFAGWTRTSSTGPFDDSAGVARYGGRLPDYVLGTDWRKMTQVSATPPMAEPQPADAAVDDYDSPIGDDPPPREAASQTEASGRASSDEDERFALPSIDRGAARDAAARAEAAPSPAPAETADEATPEAAGDTSIGR